MKSITVSTRLEVREARSIDLAAKRAGQDRASFLKQLIRRGFSDVQYERACEAYRRGDISLSRAAEIAGISYRDFLARMPEVGLEFDYSVKDLEQDLKATKNLWP